MIKFKNVSKQYASKKVINDISLTIKEGEIYGLIGLSGAGKSTILRMISGLEAVSSGQVIINDGIRFGFIFQQFNLISSLTVYENIKLSLLNSNLTDTEVQDKVLQVLKLTSLDELKDAYPKSLSGGQKQRVGIARSLVMDVDVLLCDEATSALDPFTASKIINLLTKLNQEYGLTIVFVSHQLELIQNFCDYISIIDQGSILESGRVIDVFANPKCEVTKKLLTNIRGQVCDNQLITYDLQSTLDELSKNKQTIIGIKSLCTKQGQFSVINTKEVKC